MIRLGKNIILGFCIFMLCLTSCRIGIWWTKRILSTEQETVFITDTLEIPYPSYVDKPSFIHKIKWRELKPDTIQVVQFLPIYDSLWRAITLTKNKDRVRVIVVKNDSVYAHTFYGVKDDFIWWASDKYYEGYILQTRFSNPVKWTGISLTNEISILPYVTTSFGAKTGCSFWRFTFEGYYKNREMMVEQKRKRDNVIGISSELRIW